MIIEDYHQKNTVFRYIWTFIDLIFFSIKQLNLIIIILVIKKQH